MVLRPKNHECNVICMYYICQIMECIPRKHECIYHMYVLHVSNNGMCSCVEGSLHFIITCMDVLHASYKGLRFCLGGSICAGFVWKCVVDAAVVLVVHILGRATRHRGMMCVCSCAGVCVCVIVCVSVSPSVCVHFDG